MIDLTACPGPGLLGVGGVGVGGGGGGVDIGGMLVTLSLAVSALHTPHSAHLVSSSV